MLRCFRSLAVLALVQAAPVAGAQSINRAATGLATAAQTITFEGQADLSMANTQYAAQGVTFGPNLYYTGSSWFGATGGNATALNNYPNNFCPCFSPTDIYFTNAVRGAAFQFLSNYGVSTFTALLTGNVVYAFSDVTDDYGRVATQWYGFDNTIAFDQINIQSGGSAAFVLDNLQVGEAVVTTPEPASMTLVATGLVGMFGLARRRRNRG